MKKVLLILGIIALATAALAQTTAPMPPHQFFGSVTVNGNPAPVGTSISAQVNGDTHGSTVLSQEGQYGYDDIFYVEEGQAQFDGETITFYIEGEQAATYAPYENGQSTQLNLAATIEGFNDNNNNNNQNTATNNGGGGGGGGGAGGAFFDQEENDSTDTTTDSAGDGSNREELAANGSAPVETTDAEATGCQPNWKCSEWTACVNGFQNRKCVDINQCGTEEGIPAEKRTCGSDEPEDPATGLLGITGAVIGGGTTTWIGFLGVLAIIGAIAGYRRMKR